MRSCTYEPDWDSRLKAWSTDSRNRETSGSPDDLTSSLASHAQLPSKEADYIGAVSGPLVILELRAIQHWKALLCKWLHILHFLSHLTTLRYLKSCTVHRETAPLRAAQNFVTASAINTSPRPLCRAHGRCELNDFPLYIVHVTGIQLWVSIFRVKKRGNGKKTLI